jgi:hypothetical protein
VGWAESRSEADMARAGKYKNKSEARNLLGSALNPCQDFGI